ncbi:MAG: glycoside hydrolase family 26 protein [Solirubrobacteraceae bacterium]
MGPSAAPASSPGDTLGVYTGSAKSERLGTFERRLGRNVARAHDYLDKTSWSTMLDIGWMADRWRAAGFGNRMVITVPMFPDSQSGSGLLARGAQGEFNRHFRTLARKLVSHGLGSAVLRLGHEFNGDWYKWTIETPNGGRDYAAYWRQIVTTMRSVSGEKFKFDWSANSDSAWTSSGTQLQAADAWPGTGFVDYVGLSIYDQSWVPNYQDPVTRWKAYVSQRNGLAWHAAFAAGKGKRMTFPEWAVVQRPDGHGGGDAPYFIRQMHGWITSHDVAYHLYFDFRDGEGEFGIFSGAFPNAAQAFVQLFGGGGAGSSFDIAEFARLCIERAGISRKARRLKLLATISRGASGAARVELRAGGRKARFSKKISYGRVKLTRRLSRKQARKGTGIVTITYGGNAHTRPQQVRMRIAPRKAKLRLLAAPTLVAGALHAHGQIRKSARGVVRVQLKYEHNARAVTREYKAKIRKGHWRLDAPLSQQVRSEIAGRRGDVHAYVLYTGSLPRRIGGQMKSFQLLGPR